MLIFSFFTVKEPFTYHFQAKIRCISSCEMRV